MPTESGPSTTKHDWNSFQRLHKGKWNKDELRRQWSLYKEQQQRHGAADPAATAVPHSREQHLAALKAGLVALTQSSPASTLAAKEAATQHPAAGSASYSAASSCVAHEKQQHECSHVEEAEEFLSISTGLSAADADASPSSTAGSAPRLSGVQAHELAKLREAVQHLLSKQHQQQQYLQQHTSVSQQQQSQPQLQQQSPQPEQQQQPRQTYGDTCGSPFVGSGCLPRTHGSRLSWNAFQKACKGRGLSKTEISAAYQQAKEHYQRTGQLPDLDACLQQQQQHGLEGPWHAQPVQQQQQRSKWGTLQHWLHSRGGSRACSTTASPSSSPAHVKQPGPQQQQQSHQQGKWGAFKEWLHSRSSSRAASRLCSPAASPGMQCQQQQQVKQQQQHRPSPSPGSGPGAAQKQQQLLLCSHDDANDAYLPFAHQQLCQHPAVQPQQQGLAPHADSPASSSSCSTPTRPQATIAATSSSHCSAVAIVATASVAGASSQAAGTSTGATAPAASSHSSAAAAGVPRIGHRLVREAVPHDLPGLLEGFGDWVRVDVNSRQLRRLKRAVPAQPGLYEWGVQLPLSTTDQQDPTKPQYGTVLSFYLGKAGTLQPQRPRRSRGHYSTSGETLRTRLNKYCLTKAGKVGPVNEPHKAAFFAQLLQAGGRLHYRWRVCTDVEPAEAETSLLQRLDYSLNYMHNHSRRPLMLFAA